MKNLFRIDSTFVQKMSLVFDLMLINILWLICCIPILTIGASTTAMHAAVYTLADDTTGYVRKFFRVFRDSFVQSTLSMLLFAALATILCVDILGMQLLPESLCGILQALFWLGAFFLMLCSAHLPILLFRYENTLTNMWRNSVKIGWSALPITCLMAALDLLPWLLLWFCSNIFWFLGFLWMTLYFSASAYVNIRLFRRFIQPRIEPGN